MISHTLGIHSFLQDCSLQAEPGLAEIQSRIPYFFAFESEEKLQETLNYPYKFFLEVGGHKSLDISLASHLTKNPDFALCMTTQSAYHTSLAHAVALNLNNRFGLQNEKSMEIQTCLQEAVSNAIIHGNLSVDSDFSSMEGLDAYYSLIEIRLKCEPYKYRRVSISAWDCESHLKIAVTDQGTGFKLPENPASTDMPHGRGLTLIEALANSMWIDDNLRTIFMTFNYG